jgi:hypothetical protein
MRVSLRGIFVCVALCVAPVTAFAQASQTRPPESQQQLRMPEGNTGSYSFLEGCWVTDEFKYAPDRPPSRSTYCFDEAGRGNLVFRNKDRECRVAASASYQGDTLRIVDSDGKCSDSWVWYSDHLDCQRGANGIAYCTGRSRYRSWTVTLRRQAGP